MFNLKSGKQLSGGVRGFLISIGICVGILLFCAFIASIALTGVANSSAKINLYSLIALIIAAMLSGAALSRLKGEGGALYTFLSSLAVTVIMLAAGLIISRGSISAGSFMNYGCYIGVSALSGYLFRKKNSRQRRKRHSR